MIQPNELRIGNLVQLSTNSEIIQIEGIDHDQEGYDGYYVRYENGTAAIYTHWPIIEPIPLTEEWLIKLGGEMWREEEDVRIYKFGKGYHVSYCHTEFNGPYRLGQFTCENFDMILKPFVHWFQNYTLFNTGMELKITDNEQ